MTGKQRWEGCEVRVGGGGGGRSAGTAAARKAGPSLPPQPPAGPREPGVWLMVWLQNCQRTCVPCAKPWLVTVCCSGRRALTPVHTCGMDEKEE